jgi:tetratricopeptide (TPR) repeat protein
MTDGTTSHSGPEGHDPPATRSELSGSAHDVVQARDVSGGVHFHQLHPVERTVPRQLPGDVRGFVGRGSELDFLDSVGNRPGAGQETVVISTIAGTAGVGKTSLAVHWAHRARDRFPDGQLYINLRGYDPGPQVTAGQALQRFLVALGVAPPAVPEDTEAQAALYRSLLSGKRVLIVLDNAATVAQVRPLLPGAATCLVLVTSRSRLAGLVVRDGAHRLNLDVLTPAESVDLITRITAGHRDADPPEAVAELGRLCAYLPLALRIAGERAATHPRWPLEELIRELRDESSLWDALSADEESDAVHAVFAWSYRALPAEAARLFRLLGLHPGPDFSVLAAAELGGVPPTRARRLLDSLVGANLLGETAYDRCQFHDLLRAYAAEQATHDATPDERRAAVARICGWYYRAMAAAAAVHDAFYADDWGVAPAPDDLAGLPSFADYDQAMAWFTTETDNLVATCRAAAAAGLDDIAWTLPALLRTPYLDRRPAGEWIQLAQPALAAATRLGDARGRAITLVGLSIAYRQLQQIEPAIAHSRAALEAAETIGDPYQTAAALVMLGHAQRRGRLLDDAVRSYEQALRVAAAGELPLWTVWATIGLAEALLDAGHNEQAGRRIAEALALLRPGLGDGARSECLAVLAWINRESGRLDDADTNIHEALAIAYDTKNILFQGSFEIELGRVLFAAGRHGEALTAFQHATTIGRRMGDRSTEATALDETGLTYQALGRLAEAADFHRLAAVTHGELDDAWRRAVALGNLATSLDRLGERPAALANWREARSSLAGFPDPRAVGLLAAVDANIDGAPPA